MKSRILSWHFLFILLVVKSLPCLSQNFPSSCDIPWVLTQYYDQDVKNLAVKNLMVNPDSDTIFVTIPQSQQTPIMEGLAAVFNMNHPARDSIFDLYCVHDLSFRPVGNNMLIYIDTSATWTQNWQNLQTFTGLPALDTLLVRYDLHVTNWLGIPELGIVKMNTGKLLNPYALEDSLQWASSDILQVEPDWLVNPAGKILYEITDHIRHYEFSFEWSNFLDFADHTHTWKFDVYPDCSVDYLGTSDWFLTTWEPLPAPLNCNITTGKPAVIPGPMELTVFPNPANDRLFIRLPGQTKGMAMLEVIDLSGKLCQVRQVENLENYHLDISALPEGMYIIRLKTAGQLFSARFIK